MRISKGVLAVRFSQAINPRRIARSLSTVLVFTLLQIAIGVDAPYANAASGSVGQSTASGTCASTVGETSYVTATFVNDAFCLLKFSTGTTWTVPTGVVSFDVLLVGGGGGGGADGGGGGGGGGVGTVSGIVATAGMQATVTIGAGGNGVIHTPSTAGSSGGTSSLVFNGSTYSATGGAVATGYSPNANYAAAGSVSGNVTNLISGDMSKGGRNAQQIAGGFGTAGSDGPSTSFVTGSAMYFAGGGGGGTCAPGNNAASNIGMPGGNAGGGRGSQHTQYVGSDAGQPGVNGLGGGGGGGSACDDGPGTAYGTYQRTAGGRGGDGVVYIKFVPVVSISSNPQPASGAIGATVTFSATPATTISGAVRTKKWQVLVPGGSWTDISGTNSDSYTTPTLTRSMHRNQYRYVVTDTVGTAVSTTFSAGAFLNVLTPQNETDTAITSSAPTTGYTTVAGANEITPSSSESFTIEAWIYPTNACSVRCTIAAREGAFRLTYYNNKISFVPWNGATAPWQDLTAGVIPLSTWAHVALVRNGTSFKVFINASLVATYTLTYSPNANLDSRFYVASINTSGSEPFFGSIDELKVWKSDRSASLAADMSSNETSTATLAAYWNFNEGRETIAYNQVPTATSETDFTLYSANFWDANVISETSTSGVYTVRKFKRTYITAMGGWKAPSYVSGVSALIVAGGGGGGYNSGGGGSGGGVLYQPVVTASGYQTVVVGMGGAGATAAGAAPTAGFSSIFGAATVIGGNPGGNYPSSQAGGAAVITATGSSGAGGAGAANQSSAGSAGSNGFSSSITGTPVTYAGGGGGGGWATYTNGGAGGADGGGAGGLTNSVAGKSGTALTGGGGGGGSASGAVGGSGGSGIVIVRWITASKPAFTQPTVAYLNAGMTETFTTNVVQDSATAGLTRTFRWESTTPTSGGVYQVIKQGTGAANASFSWVPTDTTTSGSGYLYRVIVTDSDTAGLFIQETSIPVYAIINLALRVTGASTVPKAINVQKSETYTITLGTPTYRISLSPIIPGITLDTSTAGFAVLRTADTLTVGTYLETLTVIDSVSASLSIPLSIVVAGPPSLADSGEIENAGLVFNLDFSNSNSYNPDTGVIKDISGANRTITKNGSPTYSNDFSGIMTFQSTGTSQYLKYTNTTQLKKFTMEAYVRLDANPADQRYLVTSQYTVGTNNINYAFVIDQARTIWAGHYPQGFIGYRTAKTLDIGTWYHVAATWDRLTTKIYIDGVLQTDGAATTVGSATDAPLGGSEVYINRKWDADAATDLSLGYVRIFDRDLSADQVVKNFNATRTRFLTANANQLKPTKKYGLLTLESFTATSGYETKTVTLARGDRAGIDWDTASVTNRLNLSIQESLTVDTYNDTITVTDSLGQSSFLPMKISVTKADTLTVAMSAGATAIYSGSVPANAPRAYFSGLVGVDSATVGTTYAIPCALGGTCKIGDLGPGGGYVFYIANTPINAAVGVSDGGIYLESAPRNWNGDASSEASSSFASVLTSVAGTSSAIGTGAENSRLLRNALGDSATAATKALTRTFNGKSDWFVPSYNELTTMISTLTPLGLGNFSPNRNLWSSTQNSSDSTRANNAWSSNPPVLNTLLKTDNYFLRPIRAFSPLYSDTTTPIDADTYTARGVDLIFLTGAESNYQAIVYETSTLRINQANQAKLNINLYGAVAGQAFTLQISGGSGDGAVTETVTAGSTALNCRISNRVLSNDTPESEQKSCNILITKAASRNYKAETLTATVYFMIFVNSQPRGQMGSGSTIALNGLTSYSIDLTVPPTITGFSTSTLSTSAQGNFTITGANFANPLKVYFWDGIEVAASSSDGINIVIPISSLSNLDIETGRLRVVAANGPAVSPNVLVVTP